MSCGQIALVEEGFIVKEYFASEIEPNAIKVTTENFPDTKEIPANGFDDLDNPHKCRRPAVPQRLTNRKKNRAGGFAAAYIPLRSAKGHIRPRKRAIPHRILCLLPWGWIRCNAD